MVHWRSCRSGREESSGEEAENLPQRMPSTLSLPLPPTPHFPLLPMAEVYLAETVLCGAML